MSVLPFPQLVYCHVLVWGFCIFLSASNSTRMMKISDDVIAADINGALSMCWDYLDPYPLFSEEVLWLLPFYRCRNLEGEVNLPKGTQTVIGRAGVQSQAGWTPKPVFLHLTTLLCCQGCVLSPWKPSFPHCLIVLKWRVYKLTAPTLKSLPSLGN